jgi:hypothetical protein
MATERESLRPALASQIPDPGDVTRPFDFGDT